MKTYTYDEINVFIKELESKRQTMRLRINERCFISGVVFYIPLEGLANMASDDPDPQDTVFTVHHRVSVTL